MRDEPYLGSIAAGEPHAALAARDTLRAGGSAADAAAALALTLTVTRPSRASLWAGGVCLVHDSGNGEQDAYSFTHPPGAKGGPPPPMLARGIGLMQAKHGLLRWSAVTAAAERLARFGHTVSRAFASDLAGAEGAAGSAFADGRGAPLREGATLVQPELAETLGRMRLHGPGALYSGPLAARLVQGAAAAGHAFDEGALPAALPSRQAPLSAEGDDWQAYFAADQASAGPRQAALWPKLDREDRPADGDAAALALPVPEPVEAGGMHAGGGGTGFAVVDADGLAVACALTMNAPFGLGRLAAGTGIAIAAPVPQEGFDPDLSAFLVTSASGKEVRFAGAATGAGAERTGPLIALRALAEADTLEAAIALPRAVRGSGRQALVEAAVPDAVRVGLRDEGYELEEAGEFGFVAAIHCPAGASSDPGAACEAGVDPRGAGLAVRASGGRE